VRTTPSNSGSVNSSGGFRICCACEKI